jgi:hypothetical protein
MQLVPESPLKANSFKQLQQSKLPRSLIENYQQNQQRYPAYFQSANSSKSKSPQVPLSSKITILKDPANLQDHLD